MYKLYLNHIQLKAARCVLNLGVREIGLLIQTSRTTISKLERNRISISNMRLANKRNIILQEFFNKNYVSFPNNHSIALSCINNIDNYRSATQTIASTRFQLRASRIIINKTQADLASMVQVAPSVIKKVESYRNNDLLQAEGDSVVCNLLNLFRTKGLEFPTPYLVSFKNFS